MKNIKEKIIDLRIDILKDKLEALGLTLIGSVLITIEFIVKLIPLVWIYNYLEGREQWDFQSTDFFDDASSIIYCTQETKRQIKYLKSQLKEQKRLAKQQTKKQPEEQPKKEEKIDNVILEYAKELVAKCSSLPKEEQQVIVLKIKEILDEYIAKYKEILLSSADVDYSIGSMHTYLLNQTTLKKLTLINTVIDNQVKAKKQIDTLTKGEEEILSMIDITDQMKQQETLSLGI